MRRRLEVALTLCIGTSFLSSPSPAQPGVQTYTVKLTGEAEIAAGASGDRDGAGSVKLAVASDLKHLCYEFRLSKLATPLMAHIHRGPAPENGPSVVTLFTGPGGHMKDCVLWTEKRLAEIVANPSNFYVNVSTTEYPDGAVRGQLAS